MNSKQNWLNFVQAIDFPAQGAEDVYADLHAQYTQPTRAYHNLAHIEYVLTMIEELTDTPSADLILAAWFHDVIYDSKAKDNEAKSAALALASLSPYDLTDVNLERVEALILATIKHEAPADDLEMQILLDADLAVFSWDRDSFAKSSKAIRQEFAWVEAEAYRNGRINALKHFATRPQIYFTAQMQAAHEQQALANLEWEIAQLQASAK